MKRSIQCGVVATMVGAGVALLVWMFLAKAASNRLVGNANVGSGIVGVAAFILTVLRQWPKRTRQVPPTPPQLDAAVEYLAAETLRHWRQEAKNRRITTPAPATVRWQWASPDVAAPSWDLDPALLTDGVVTRLREQLYQPNTRKPPQRIVILGGPGAGKTTAMLLLLIDVLNHRVTDSPQPVPVWLTLGSWNPETTSLRDWAATILRRDYRLAVDAYGGRTTAGELLRTGRLALFCDGLDEMADDLRACALQRIDEEAQHLRVVLTSRPDEYTDTLARQELWDAAVIEVLPVDAEHVGDFLLRQQRISRRHAWQPVVNHLRDHPESVTARTLTSPLALSLARDAYARSDPTEILSIGEHATPAALLQRLLTQSLVIAYPDQDERNHAIRWLAWLARCMGTRRDLRWWEIPAWMAGSRKALNRTLTRASGLAFGLVGGLAGGLAVGLTRGYLVGVMGASMVGLVFGLGGLGARTAEWDRAPQALHVRWPRRREVQDLALGVTGGVIGGLAVGLATGMAFGFGQGSTLGAALGPMVGCTVALMLVWSRPIEALMIADPLQTYRSDLFRTVTFGVLFGLASGLITGFTINPLIGILMGLAGGLMVALLPGKGPASDFQVMSVCWSLLGKRVRFMLLLKTAAERQVLRQAGAVYQFRHAALQDLLAEQGAAPPTPASPTPDATSATLPLR